MSIDQEIKHHVPTKLFYCIIEGKLLAVYTLYNKYLIIDYRTKLTVNLAKQYKAKRVRIDLERKRIILTFNASSYILPEYKERVTGSTGRKPTYYRPKQFNPKTN